MPRDEVLLNARPTVRIRGLEMPVLDRAILSMMAREQAGGLSSLELTLLDWSSAPDGRAGFAAAGSENPLKLGAPIEIYCGDVRSPQQVFAGRITALEAEAPRHGPPRMTVLAEDALFAARRVRRRRLFEDASPADVVRVIAEDHGLTPEIRDGLDVPLATWAQVDESDLSFLRRVLASVDADAQAVAEALQAGPRARDRRTEVELVYPRDLLQARITADLARQTALTTAAGFDPLTGEAVRAESADPELGPGQGREAADILRAEFEAWEGHLGDLGAVSQAEADAAARAAQGASARGFVIADGIAQGDPAIRVGSRLALVGVNPMFENAYCVTSAIHRFDREDGYVTEFIAECAYLGAGA
ncbi:contractile injection system protein, VgrG/Pvc8 family [Albimonas sp. CAU 1670]|uniref:phage late control D family protein n=1 Tax=Albimonas sp. CAU 1670 TaxID=3032599 RepID=UPI0023DB35A1|nr:contractile injection system protein, VgrG/Pvc8 family [Albimonas sp. CAU 1670]MDF2235424.1 contractile injection system protein, VgrG/Pvc8 family [Albimonas sp. CAU 1670]